MKTKTHNDKAIRNEANDKLYGYILRDATDLDEVLRHKSWHENSLNIEGYLFFNKTEDFGQAKDAIQQYLDDIDSPKMDLFAKNSRHWNYRFTGLEPYTVEDSSKNKLIRAYILVTATKGKFKHMPLYAEIWDLDKYHAEMERQEVELRGYYKRMAPNSKVIGGKL